MKKFSILLLAMLISVVAYNQVAINTDNSAAGNSAMLDVKSTNKGFLPPRMTTAQRDVISSPAEGLCIYNTDEQCVEFWDGTQWNSLCCPLPAQPSEIVGETVPSVGATETYSITEVADLSYAWTTPADWTIISGQGTHTIDVTVGEDLGNIEVTPSNDCGNGTARTLVVNPTLFPAGTVYCLIGPTAIVDVTNPTTGETWMDRNLGAYQQATSSTDASSYGNLYQWGRFSDGHQCRTSSTISTIATTEVPNAGNDWDGKFIMHTTSTMDWITPQNASLWQDVSGTNNPCPTGYRLPTLTELTAEYNSWSPKNLSGAYASPLKLSAPGGRYGTTGLIGQEGERGDYWSSTVGTASNYLLSRGLYFRSSSAGPSVGQRSFGGSVRCIKD